MLKKWSRVFALCTALILLATACGKASESTRAAETQAEGGQSAESAAETGADSAASGDAIKISILTAQGSYRADEFTEMSKIMKEKYNYEIDWQVLPDDQYYVLAKAKIATGEVPDIIEYNTPSNNIELGATENCVPLDDQPWVKRLVNPDLLKDPDDGKIYAMPRDAASFFGAIYYNKGLLEQLSVSTEQPKTMDEYVARLQEIKEKSNGEVTPLFCSNADSWTTQIFMTLGFSVQNYPNDGEIYQKLLKNELTFPEAPGFAEVMQQYKDFYALGLVNEDHLSASYDAANVAFGEGKAATILQGEWFVPMVKGNYPDIKFGAWAIPYDGKDMIATGAYVRAWFAMKGGKQVDKVLEFMDRWSQQDVMGYYFQKQPGFPAFSDIDGGDVDPAVQELFDTYIKGNKYTYQINDPMGVASSIFPDLWKMYIDMVASDREPKAVLEDWQKQYADYMKQLGQPGF